VTSKVLVVDDDRVAGLDYATLLQRTTGLPALFAASVDDALNAVRTGEISVAVIDQRMEPVLGVAGTQLGEKIRSIDSRVRFIIFSGQAEQEDVEYASDLEVRFLRKQRIEELPGIVHQFHTRYLVDLAGEYENRAVRVGSFRPPGIFKRSTVALDLLAIERVADAPEARASDYETIAQLVAGQQTETTVVKRYEIEHEFEWESANELQISIPLGAAALGHLAPSVESSIRERSKASTRDSSEHTVKVTYSLPSQDIAAGVVMRRIKRAPLYFRMRAIIRLTCDCCGLTDTTLLGFRSWSGFFTELQEDRMKDKSVNTIDLGRD
jgi:CheY-like chemotaxis protein